MKDVLAAHASMMQRVRYCGRALAYYRSIFNPVKSRNIKLMKIGSENFDLKIYKLKISNSYNTVRKLLLISNIISILFYLITPSYSFAADATSDYIRSFLGEKVSIGDVYEVENGSPLKKRDDIRISIVNQPDNKVKMFAVAKILDFANALNLSVDFRNGDQTNEIMLFDDFVDNNNSFKNEVFNKYGIKIEESKVPLSFRSCFVIRHITNGSIDNSVYIIDNKLEFKKTNDCILRSITFSFGLKLKPLKSQFSEKMKNTDDFVSALGPFIASRRDVCFNSSHGELNYSCMSK